MKMKGLAFVLGISCAAPSFCGAATVRLETPDAGLSATTSFNGAGGWSSGEAPSAGNDYVVALGAEAGLWFPSAGNNANVTFAGDRLTVGDETAPGRLDCPSVNETMTVADMVWRRGVLARTAANYTLTLQGKTTVEATAADPFVIEGAKGFVALGGGGHSLVGGDDAAILIRSTDPSQARPFRVKGIGWSNLNLSKYTGQIVIDNASLQIGNFTSGLTALRKDAVVLRNKGAIVSDGAKASWGNTNLCVTVEPTGGAFVSGYRAADVRWTVLGGPLDVVALHMDYYGHMEVSELVLKGGTSPWTTRFMSGSRISVTNLVVAGGLAELKFDAGVTCLNETPFPISVQDGKLYVENLPERMRVRLAGGVLASAGTNGALDGLEFESGSVLMPVDAAAGTVGCMTLTGAITGLTEANPISVVTSGPLPVSVLAAGPVRALAVPVGSLELTAKMVDVSKIELDDKSKTVACSVVEEGGMRYAELSLADVERVSLLSGDAAFAPTTAFNGNGAQWSDGLAPHAGRVYDVALGGDEDGKALRAPTVDAAFAGVQLNVGTPERAGRLEFGAAKSYTIASANLVKGAIGVSVAKGQVVVLGGALAVASGRDDPFAIRGAAGTLKLQDDSLVGSADAACVFRATGDPLAFGIEAGSSWPSSGFRAYAGQVVLDGVFSVHAGLNTAHETLRADAIVLKNGAQLRCTAAGPVWEGNAGVTVDATGGSLSSVYPSRLTVRVPFAGGPLTVKRARQPLDVSFRSALSLSSLSVQDAVVVRFGAGATLSCGGYELKDGEMWFEPGVAFAGEGRAPLAVTGGTLHADAAAIAHLALSIANATFCAGGDGTGACETYELSGATLADATVVLDIDPEGDSCDRLAFTGETTVGFGVRNPLRIEFTSPMPSARRASYAVMTFPAGVRKLAAADFDISGIVFGQDGDDGVHMVALDVTAAADGTQTVTVSRRRKGGFMILVR